MPAGRPSSFTPEVGTLISREIADGKSIRQVCRENDWAPDDHHTVLRWEDEFPEFSAQLARAREYQADYFVDKGNEIIDTIQTGEDAQVANVKLAWLKWTAGKGRPKRYGDKQEIDLKAEVSVKQVVVDV